MTAASYTISALNIGFSANKCMISVFNPTGSGRVVKVYRIWAHNNQIVAVTGVLTNLEVRKLSAASGGTTIMPTRHDSNSALIVAAPTEVAASLQTVTAASWAANVSTFTLGSGTAATVNTATWSAGLATYTTSAVHGYSIGNYVTVSGVTPSGYNVTGRIFSVPSTTTFTVAIASTPGAYTSGGSIVMGHGFAVGNSITVAGTTPSGYDGVYDVATVPSSTTLTVAELSNPGAYVSDGEISPGIIAGTNQTVTLSSLYRRVLWSTDEPTANVAITLDELECFHAFGNIWSMGYADTTVEPITLNAGEGLAVMNTGASVGQADFFFELTVA